MSMEPFDECRTNPTDGPLHRLTKLAADALEAPIAALHVLVDDHLQPLATHGAEADQHIEIQVICARVLETNAALVLRDASDHERLGFYAGIPLVTTQGQPIGVLSLADVKPRSSFSEAETSRLQAYAELAADLLASRKADQIREIGAGLLAAMNHDVRTPMNGVLGMAELLLASEDLDAPQRRRVETIKRSGTALLAMLDRLFDFVRTDAEKLEPEASLIDLASLLQEACNQGYQNHAGKPLRFELIGKLEDYGHVLGDECRLRKLLARFLDSTARLTTAATIDLSVSVTSSAFGKIRMRLQAEDVSIDSREIQTLLGPLTNKTRHSSTCFDEVGVSLMTCKKIAMMMGGDVCAHRLAEGYFTLFLSILLTPASSKQAARVVSEDRPKPANTTAHGKRSNAARHVLVAEDDPDMAELLEQLLEEAGYKATIAHDGATALSLFDEERYDVVLMDGRMPDMSGLETAQQIRRLPDERAHIPIIALTGEALVGDRQRYISGGMDDYILKPIDYRTLIDAIERCCDN